MKPQKSHARSPDKKGFSIALPKTLIKQIEEMAQKETRSRNGQIQHMLEKMIAEHKGKSRPFEVIGGVGKKFKTG